MLLGLQLDLLVRVSSYLSAREICGLAETCRADLDDGSSLVDEISRRLFEAASAHEKALLPKHDDETYAQLYHRLLMLRLPLRFDHLIGRHIAYRTEGDKSAVRVMTAPSGYDWNLSTAICLGQVMRSGRHFARFTPTEYTAAIHVGIIRPILVEGASDQPIFSPFARTFMALDLQRRSRNHSSPMRVQCKLSACCVRLVFLLTRKAFLNNIMYIFSNNLNYDSCST